MTNAPNQLAIFIDVDNLCVAVQEAGLPFRLEWLMERLRQEGRIMLARAYAHWPNWQRYIADFQKQAFEFAELPTSESKKNTADIQMALDALEMALSNFAPETMAIVSGDRDFVPLVQKLKRYNVRVIGIGVEGTVSTTLRQCCDTFLYYDNLVPAGLVGEANVPVAPLVDTQPVYALLARAVNSLTDQGRMTVGAAVYQMMQQLDPTFDLARYKRTFKELALNAMEQGFVTVTMREGSDMLIHAGTNPPAPQVSTPIKREKDELSFDTAEQALESYKSILLERRIPLLSWKLRQELVDHLWYVLQKEETGGLTIYQMITEIEEYAHRKGLNVPRQACSKIVYTLNFARCFTDAIRGWYQVKETEFGTLRVLPAIDATTALFKMNLNYIKSIRIYHPNARLYPEAVATLLYGNTEPDAMRDVAEIINELQPPTAMALAIQEQQA